MSLDLSKKDWKKIFSNLNELSYEDRIDYLYIKFIYFGFINLENEKELLNSIKKFDTKIRLSKLIAIYSSLKLPTSIYLLCFLCSIEVYTEKFGRFHIANSHESLCENNNIKRAIKIIGYSFSEIYKKELHNFIVDITLNKHYYFQDIVLISKAILNDLLNLFKIKNNDNLNSLLLQHIYMAIFKKKNNILKIRSVYFHSSDKVFLDKLDFILKKYKIELYLYDKHRIITDVKKEYIKIQTFNLKKILILLNDIGTLKQLNLKTQLNYEFPNIHFDIEYNFLNNKLVYKKNYDLCINDNELTIAKGDIIDRVKQQIEKHVIKNIPIDKLC